MKTKFIIPLLLLAFTFTACQDCKDCQSTADITLTKKFFATDLDGNYVLDSTKTHTLNTIGRFAMPATKDDSLSQYITPISIMELCGTDLSDADGNSLSFESTLGDTASGTYTYSWTETWDCK